jgi:hypothetical protein
MWGLGFESHVTPAACLHPDKSKLCAPFDRWINAKKAFRKHYGIKHLKGMEPMLTWLGMEWREGIIQA